MISSEKRRRRLARRLYETGVMFAIAIVVALVLVVGMSLHARGHLTCAAESIATASAQCSHAVDPSEDAPSHVVRVVFASDASAAAFGR